MFGKKPENANQEDVMNLIGSKKTAPKVETEKTQQQKIQESTIRSLLISRATPLLTW